MWQVVTALLATAAFAQNGQRIHRYPCTTQCNGVQNNAPNYYDVIITPIPENRRIRVTGVVGPPNGDSISWGICQTPRSQDCAQGATTTGFRNFDVVINGNAFGDPILLDFRCRNSIRRCSFQWSMTTALAFESENTTASEFQN